MKKRGVKFSAGDFFQIALGDNEWAFGRVLEHGEYGFYNGRFRDAPSMDEIATLPIIFRIWVVNYAIKSGRWKLIGNRPLEATLRIPSRFYIRDPINKSLSIYDPKDSIPATYDQCIGLERASVWDPEHVEERLRDFFDGRPNKWVESMKAMPPN